MIRFEDVSVTYAGRRQPSVRGVDFEVPEGELVLLVGPSGVGKSTLLGAVSGLVPHFTGGTLRGRVTVAGRDTRTHKPRELADVVGTVGQDPLSHFVTDTVEDELAYGMESLGLAPAVMRRRVEETLDLLGLADLRDRPIATLSGGQQQRVAIGSVLTPHPRVLVLDEPTSALDPARRRGGPRRPAAAGPRPRHDGPDGRAPPGARRAVRRPGRPPARRRARRRSLGAPAEIMAVSPVHPPVVALGRLAGWSPLPLSVRDARRRARACASALAQARTGRRRPVSRPRPRRRRQPSRPAPAASPASRLLPRRATAAAVAEVPPSVVASARPRRGAARRRPHGRGRRDLALWAATAPASPRCWPPWSACVEPDHRHGPVGGARPAPHPARATWSAASGLVPQEPRDLLYADTVAAECAAADPDAGAAPGTCRALVVRAAARRPDDTHPRDLSEGQRLALALAVVLTARPPLLLLDEPTRGLDYAAKARLVDVLRGARRRRATRSCWPPTTWNSPPSSPTGW